MSLNSKNYETQSKFKTPDPLEVGTYPARVVQIIDLGLQKQDPYKGEEKEPKVEICVTYEFLDEFLKDEDGNDLEDKPRWLSEKFTMNHLDSDLAKSTKRYMALDPELEHDGDWSKLLGAPCMVTIVNNEGKGKHSGKVFNNITSVQSMRAKEQSKAPPLVNEPKMFDVDEPDIEVFLSLPEFRQDQIKSNLNYEGSVLEIALEEHKNSSGREGAKEASKATEGASQDVSDTTESDGDDW